MVKANTDKTYILDDCDYVGDLLYTEDLGKIKWIFVHRFEDNKCFRMTVKNELDEKNLAQTVLFYDSTFKAEDNAELERDSWRFINSPGFDRSDYPNETEGTVDYNNAQSKFNNYLEALNLQLDLFTIGTFRGYYKTKQSKSGVEIVLYNIDENNNIQILTKKTINFEKREKKE